MQVLESKIEAKACKLIKDELGVLSIKLNISGNTGIPDRLFLLPKGKVVFIEFKKPGGVTSPKQKYWIKILKKLGFPVEVYDNVEDAYKKLKEEMGTS